LYRTFVCIGYNFDDDEERSVGVDFCFCVIMASALSGEPDFTYHISIVK
jgi:hypothetical protein